MMNISIRGKKEGKKTRHRKLSLPQDDLNIHPKSKFAFFKQVITVVTTTLD